MSHFATSFDETKWDMAMSEAIVWKPQEVTDTLTDMRLTRDELIDAVRYAERERSFCTENDGIGFNNYLAYNKAGRALREIYRSQGWQKDNSFNQVAIRHPDLMIRIVPCNFDENAGNKYIDPTNRSPKGEVSKKKVACNRTGWLPGLPDFDPEPDDDGFQTWLLGIYIADDSPTRAELSLPIGFDGKYFTSFGKRVILLSGEEDKIKGSRKSDPGSDAVEVVDIEVRRK